MNSHARFALRPLPLLISLGLSAGLVACGSSDNPVTTKGQVIGSYYENAVVCMESATTKLSCDSNSTPARTNADGSFTVNGQGPVLAVIGTDAIRHDVLGDAGTKVTQKLILRAPAGHGNFVSALSTELTQVMDSNGGDFASASSKLAARIGVSEAALAADFNKATGDDLTKLKAENASVTSVIATASAAAAPADVLAALNSGLALNNIQTIVVIYAENRGFDNLYGLFPGANGVPGVNPTSSSAYIPQKDVDGSVLPVLPPTWGGMTAAGQSTVITQAQSANLPNQPFQIDNPNGPINLPQSVITRDLVHRFYNNQMQINGGANDKFAAYSDAGGLSMGYYDGSKMQLWNIAKQYALADNLFIGAFGGSFLTHQYLICACAPTYPNADTSVAKNSISKIDLDANGNFVRLTAAPTSPASVLNGPPVYANDSTLTPADSSGMFYAVNTMQPAFQPSSNAPAAGDSSKLYADTSKATTLPQQTQTNIGDLLSAKSIDWAWYAGAWKDTTALATASARNNNFPSPPNFQFHHQPFNYFADMDPVKAPAYRAAHLRDFDSQFMSDAAAGKLPAVTFYKPQGNLNQHSGYASVADGDAHIASVIAQLKQSPQWKNMLVIVTYDENGGYYDHVAPPKGDRWGPGTRVPAILVSPYVKKGLVDHTQYDSASILRAITHRFSLPVLNGLSVRDKALIANGGKPMGDFSAALALLPQE
ncbi:MULTISPECIES: acid phosphatase [unclassified Janthinobacterium]|uniref:acid phosphatase n=1 Tax=unclassified Janthinobacterium TaxID=2610881 RepID=UPI001610652D|nr:MULTISPECIES: acid phosphatase [unclassified Janthinobacterium]MBB5605702.1 acid phosphatase [Janthinobacterium sp. S3T4]MBB5611379.1 acid phosphatase [Janthinobacterium sp. S3M3]